MGKAVLWKWHLFAILIWPKQVSSTRPLTSFIDLEKTGPRDQWNIKNALVSNGPLTKSVDVSSIIPEDYYLVRLHKALVTFPNSYYCNHVHWLEGFKEDLSQEFPNVFEQCRLGNPYAAGQILRPIQIPRSSCNSSSFSLISFDDMDEFENLVFCTQGVDSKVSIDGPLGNICTNGKENASCANCHLLEYERQIRLTTGSEDDWAVAIILDYVEVHGREPFMETGSTVGTYNDEVINAMIIIRILTRGEYKANKEETIVLTSSRKAGSLNRWDADVDFEKTREQTFVDQDEKATVLKPKGKQAAQGMTKIASAKSREETGRGTLIAGATPLITQVSILGKILIANFFRRYLFQA